MRKLTLVLLCSMFCLTLFASDIYKSNILGQKLSIQNAIGQEGYYLEVSNTTQTLYLDGAVFLTITTYDEGTIKTVVKSYTSGEIETYKYEDGLLKSVLTEAGEITYNYIEGRLTFCIVNNSEVFFLRSTEDGQLVAIKRGSEIELLSDSYLYQNGSLYSITNNSLVFTGDYEMLEDGSFNYVDGDKIYHYSETGLLLSLSSPDETQEYFYSEDKLISIKTINSDESYKLENYDNGTLIKVEQYTKEGLITSSDDYSTSNLVRTVYKDGRPVADIYYKQDNVTVDSIKYR